MRLKEGFSGAWLAVLTVVIDRISKEAVQTMAPAALIPGILGLRPMTNTGMAFSMLSGSGGLLTLASLLITLGVTAWLIARPKALSPMARSGLWLVAGGGLGNVYDRIVHGAVIDFIEPLFIDFAVFNIADAAICIGACITAVSVFITERREEPGHGRASD